MGFNGWQNHGHNGLEIKVVQQIYIDLFVLQRQLTGKIKVRKVMGNMVVHKA